jgi:hypothetical protein
VKRLAYPAAIGCGLLGVGVSQVQAAEWSITPMYSSSVDYDSNRTLSRDARGSESGVLTADLRFTRALEDTNISIEPRYSFRRFSDPKLGNGDDRSLYASFNRSGERTSLNLTASYWDQSSLITEALETGIVRGDTHRRTAQSAGNWSWSQTEYRQLIAQLSYMDVSYYGQGSSLLPGYRYPSGSLGERFNFSERGSFTLSAYGNAISSDTRGNSSHEYGLQAQVIYAFSERTRFDASLGESVRKLAGVSSHGTDATLSLTHDITLGNLSLNYTRSLVPYGVGFLVQRQQLTASATRQFTPYLDGNISLFRIQNNQIAVQLAVDRSSYDGVSAALNWHMTETWNLGVQLAAMRTQAPGLPNQTLTEWRSATTLIWSPRPIARSW